LPFALTWLADAERQAKDRERALEHVLDAETLINESGDRFVEAELNRVRGELLLDAGDQDAAERCFSRAIDIARSQSAKFWELRAAISLAGLWRAQGKRDAARNLLGPVYGWFTEGLDTPFLKKAEALLAEL
jgi:predicted ATPase